MVGGNLFYIPVKERLFIFLMASIIIGGHSMSSLYEKAFGPKQYEIIEVATTIVAEAQVEVKEIVVQDYTQLPTLDLAQASKEELINYGFSSYAASNLVKYQEKGGSISSLEDLSKIYGVDKNHIEQISGKIRFKEGQSPKATNQSKARPVHMDSTKRPIQPAPLDGVATANNSLETEKRKLINPNTASLEELQSIGLSTYAANNLLKYRSKGGQIYKASDMLRIYGVDSSSYVEFQDYITIPSSKKESLSVEDTLDNTAEENGTTAVLLERKEESTTPRVRIDINTASEEELQNISGIGPVISKGIVSYRARLGGYISLKQLKEVYGVKEESYDMIKDQLTISGEVTKIYVPALSFKEVLKHPYIDYETTRLLKNIHYEIYDDKIKQLVKEEKIDSRLLPYLHLDIPQEYLKN